MTMPYYASAEQVMRDRSEYARKGISRGRSVAVLTYADGVLFIAENPSSTLHKVSELYDRVGFAAVGRYSEFESLRVAGIRLAAMPLRDHPDADRFLADFSGDDRPMADYLADEVLAHLSPRSATCCAGPASPPPSPWPWPRSCPGGPTPRTCSPTWNAGGGW